MQVSVPLFKSLLKLDSVPASALGFIFFLLSSIEGWALGYSL